MRIKTNRTELLSVLNTCSKSLKNGFIPATSSFRFNLIGDELFISACNLETSTCKSIKVESDGEDFDILIPADQIKRYLSLLADQPLTFLFERFEADKTVSYSIVIKSSSGDCKMVGDAAGDNFPVIATKGGDKFTIAFDDLHEAIQRTAYAMADSDGESGTVNKYSAVNLRLSKEVAEFAAFSGHSLSVHKVKGEYKDAVLLLPDGIVTLINSLSLKGDCAVEYSDKSISINVDGLEIKSMLREGKFVDYRPLQVMPDCYTCVDRLELISAIKRVLLFSNKFSNLIAMSVGGKELSISGEDVDFQYTANETIPCQEFAETIRIGLNGNFTIEALNHLATSEVYIYLSWPTKPVIFMEEIGGDSMSLIAPVTLN